MSLKPIQQMNGAFDAPPRGLDDWQRKYPSMTTAQLREWVGSGSATPLAVEELAKRDSGESTVRVTPQIVGGKVQTKIGRM
jgi:hypothetical protein